MNDFTRHSLLLALSKGPSHGYDLQTEVMRMTGGSLYIPLTTIYRILAQLDKAGHVQRLTELTPTRRKRYQLTRKGVSELQRATILYQHFVQASRIT